MSSTIWRKLAIPLLVVGCCFIVSGAYFLYSPNVERLREMKVKIEEKEARVEKLKRENEEYVDRIQKLREPPAGDSLYIEKKARQKGGLVREGETVYHLEAPTKQ
jgi:cell division protein FtsB